MGPFELMDMIGNDINYTVTETVWKQFFHDARYKPSLTQKRLVEAKRYGKKSGHGYYNYIHDDKFLNLFEMNSLEEKSKIGYLPCWSMKRLTLLSENKPWWSGFSNDKGVNYPKGLLKWCDEWGAENVLAVLEELHREYEEERYRPSILLKRMVKENTKFYWIIIRSSLPLIF